ncbi:MAG: hypothetical protein HDR43_02970 [Mycoplasma sp.]|nr:hypothetical protein [Mycoplasma sp.]
MLYLLPRFEIRNVDNSIFSNVVWNDYMVIIALTLMAFSIFLPIFIWIIRGMYRVISRRDYWWLNRLLRVSWLLGSFSFISGFVIFVLKLFSII